MTTASAPPRRPGLRVLNHISTNNIKGDLFGGLTAAIVALPLALAFGVAAFGANPGGASAGLWGAVLVGLFAALFGGTPSLISEPTGPMTVVFTAVIASLTARNPDNGLAMAFTVVMLAGVFQIAFGLLKLGRYITQMPYTVISGFMSGIGIILVVLQIGPFLGEAIPKGGVMGTLSALPQLLQAAHLPAVILGLVTLAILWLTPAAVKKVAPPQLIALVVGTLLSLTLLRGSDGEEVRRIGELASGFPQLRLPTFELGDLRVMLVDAAVLGMLGCIDALLTAVIADSITRTEHDSNKELIGQGLGNLASGLFGGLPGAGATMGTVVNIQAGGRSALSGISRAVILMLVILAFKDLASQIPQAVLAGIALKVGVDIVDWGFLKRAHLISIKGALIMYLVIVLTVLVDLIAAVGIGVFIANILTIDTMSSLQAKSVKSISTGDGDLMLPEEERVLLDQGKGQVLLFQLNGAMIFGVAKAIGREHNAISDCKAVIFDLSEVSHLGVTAALAVENAVEEAIEKGRQVFVVGAAGTTQRRLEKLGLYRKLPAECTSLSRCEALQQAVTGLA
ncbi:MAG: SulP family inorganic anion transporter [Synechococcaceae cyanobacterium]|nr:SulP family inorganic anion transporter [Synechococcaceae cyanobacterium]